VAGCYATCADFRKVFNDNVDRLYTLALLLTADRDRAEHCFLSAFEHCTRSTTVFREWAESWAKRTTITTAIRIVFRSQTLTNGQVRGENNEGAVSRSEPLFTGALNLASFDRFVYVMSVLERMPDSECALLLDCVVRDVIDAKERALQSESDHRQQNLLMVRFLTGVRLGYV
jgi:hypothetical protein